MVTIRPATLDDIDRLWIWRNDALTRANSHHTDPVIKDDHQKWLAATLANPTRRLYIGIVDAQPIGTGRIDLTADGAVMSITIAPEHRGRGLASQLIAALVAQTRERPILAEVKTHNLRSIRAFQRAGFTVSHSDDHALCFSLSASAVMRS